jgi:hypothetical protein
MIKLTQSFQRPDLNICRWAASWPRKAIWVMATASPAALASCHQELPIHTKAATQTARRTTAPINLAQ